MFSSGTRLNIYVHNYVCRFNLVQQKGIYSVDQVRNRTVNKDVNVASSTAAENMNNSIK